MYQRSIIAKGFIHPVVAIGCALVLILIISTVALHGKNPPLSAVQEDHGLLPRRSNDKVLFTREIFGNGNVEAFFTILPELPCTKLLLAFHGCTHSGLDWFRLPEEVQIVKKAKGAGLVVIAFSSKDRRSGCWSNEDLPFIADAVEDFLTKKKRSFAGRNLVSVFAVGASSGGSFVSALPSVIAHLQGLWIQIGRPVTEAIITWTRPFPRFIHLLYMTRDAELMHSYDDFAEAVKFSEFKSQPQDKLVRPDVAVTFLESRPCAVTRKRLLERVYDLSEELAESIIEQLKADKVLDLKTNHPLRHTIQKIGGDLSSKVSQDLFDSIQEEIKCCYANHELTSEFFDDILKVWVG